MQQKPFSQVKGSLTIFTSQGFETKRPVRCGFIIPPSPQWLPIILFWAILLSPTAAQAGLMLSLQAAENVDLMNLQLGQTAKIQVVLEGLTATESLAFLAGTVEYDAVLLGDAGDVLAGTIIPDPDGFLGFGGFGLADGSYDDLFTFSNLPISISGTLFSFSVTAQQVGTGNLSLTFGAARNLFDEEVAIGFGTELPFAIVAQTGQVPEPSSWLVYCLVAITGQMHRQRRRV